MTSISPRATPVSQSIRRASVLPRTLAFSRIDDPAFAMSVDIDSAQKKSQYTPRRKLGAFCRGLIIFEPMVEVARCSLKHELSESERTFYINRLIKKGRALDMHGIVTERYVSGAMPARKGKSSLDEATQLKIAKKFNSSFPADLHEFATTILKFLPLAVSGVALGMMTFGGNIANAFQSVFEDGPPISAVFTVTFLIGALAVYEAVETRKKLAGKAQEMLESGNMTCKEARMLILDTVKRFGNLGEMAGYLQCEVDERR